MTSTALTDAIARDARALLQEYDHGSWCPTTDERTLAQGLARTHWSGSVFRTALRDAPACVRAGRLAAVLAPAEPLLEFADTAGMRGALLALRQLIDALAAD